MKRPYLIVAAAMFVLSVNFAVAADKNSIGQPFQAIWNEITSIWVAIGDIELTPGEQGPQGPAGSIGPQGEPGIGWDESRFAELEARVASLESIHEDGPPVPDSVVIQEDFNGEFNNEWVSVYGHLAYGFGNWRIENNMLREDSGGNARIFVLDNYVAEDQTVEADIIVRPISGGAGITVWYDTDTDWVSVNLTPRGLTPISVTERVGGYVTGLSYDYPVSLSTWYNLKLITDSSTGEIEIYLDDEYLFTYQSTAVIRSGRTGFKTGNAGGDFDNFRLTID